MKKVFEKHETLITIILIVIYVIINAYCLQNFGAENFKTMVANLLLTLVIMVFIFKNKLGEYYGLTTIERSKDCLYFIPLILIIGVNFLNGVNINKFDYQKI